MSDTDFRAEWDALKQRAISRGETVTAPYEFVERVLGMLEREARGQEPPSVSSEAVPPDGPWRIERTGDGVGWYVGTDGDTEPRSRPWTEAEAIAVRDALNHLENQSMSKKSPYELAALLGPGGGLAGALSEALYCARTRPGGHEVTTAIQGALDALGELRRRVEGVAWGRHRRGAD
jgi:hypothetical protein